MFKTLLVIVSMALASTTAIADNSPFNGGALTLGVAVPDGANVGGILTYELGRDSLLTSYNPYASFTYITDNQETSVGNRDIVGTAIALGVSIPTGTAIKPRIGFNYNVKAIPENSSRDVGVDIGALLALGHGIAITTGYNTGFDAFNLGVGFAW